MKHIWTFAALLAFIFATFVAASGPSISNPAGPTTATAPIVITGQDISCTAASASSAGCLNLVGGIHQVDAGMIAGFFSVSAASGTGAAAATLVSNGLYLQGGNSPGIASGGALRLEVNDTYVRVTTSPFQSTNLSGANGFALITNGARIDYGDGASDYASSDGTTVTFAGPTTTTGALIATGTSGDITLGGGDITSSLVSQSFNLTSATQASTASSTVAACTVAPSATLDANDLVLEVNSAAGTSLFSIDLEGDSAVLGDVSISGGDITTPGGATGAAGTALAGTIGNGGNGSGATAGGAGGAVSWTSGTGGTGGTSGASGQGGALTILCGAGGVAGTTTGAASVGGALALTSGAGGAATASGGAGAVGGTVTITGGAGGRGANPAGGNGRAGGEITITSGVGGDGATGQTAGVGGALTIRSGGGGAAGGGTGATAGAVILDTGALVAGTAATMALGATNAGTITLGRSGQSVNVVSSIQVNAVLAFSPTAPTISSGFGTSPSVSSNNGTVAFRINVGTGGAATSGVIGLPTATTGWNCFCNDITTTSATVFLCKQTASETNSATIGNFNTSAAAAAWTASDILSVNCVAF